MPGTGWCEVGSCKWIAGIYEARDCSKLVTGFGDREERPQRSVIYFLVIFDPESGAADRQEFKVDTSGVADSLSGPRGNEHDVATVDFGGRLLAHFDLTLAVGDDITLKGIRYAMPSGHHPGLHPCPGYRDCFIACRIRDFDDVAAFPKEVFAGRL